MLSVLTSWKKSVLKTGNKMLFIPQGAKLSICSLGQFAQNLT